MSDHHDGKLLCQDKASMHQIHPMDRALATIMFGILVHFGTIWTLLSSPEDTSCTALHADRGSSLLIPSLPVLLLAHEYWIYLQHFNVLANPLCQRLDRDYGMALLRDNQHWAIAGTLSAYWCRETISMCFCLAFFEHQNVNKYLVVLSMAYHAFKSHGVRQDALQRSSSRFGVMSILIDKFYTHSFQETAMTLIRLFLQGFDTYIHARILLVLCNSQWLRQQQQDATTSLSTRSTTIMTIHVVFVIWVLHAAMNQYFMCSTATLMVRTWHSLTTTTTTKWNNHNNSNPLTLSDPVSVGSDMDGTDSDSDSRSTTVATTPSLGDQDFPVRCLLREGRVPSTLMGRQGAASAGVDMAVQIETSLTIVSLVHVVAYEKTPFRILSTDLSTILHKDHLSHEFIVSALLYTWLLLNILVGTDGILNVFMNTNKTILQRESKRQSILIRNIFDILIILIGVHSLSKSETKNDRMLENLTLQLVFVLTAMSFVRIFEWKAPRMIWYSTVGVTFFIKVQLTKGFAIPNEDALAWVDAIACLVWTLSRVQARPVDIISSTLIKEKTPDLVFLGHGTLLSDIWAMWLLPYSLQERWQRPWWSIPLWPLHYIIGILCCHFRLRLLGDSHSFFNCDDVNYAGTQMQTWVATHVARHFFTSPWSVKANIEAAARFASQTGVKVFCLGALNKAEGINGGGVTVARSLPPESKMVIIHGNHLTAAAVVETTRQCFGPCAKVFLTGASSKVGWAVAQALRDRFGYEILCHSTDPSRRDHFLKHGFQATSKLTDGTMFSDLWIVGKYDPAVAHVMPQGGTAVVFAVPHPLDSRPDVRVVEAGTLHMDLTQFDKPRRFANKLKAHEIFACHAAGVVAVHRIKCGNAVMENCAHETGPVDPEVMDDWLKDAKTLGFSIPFVAPSDGLSCISTSRVPTTVIVGAGLAGLAVAAALRRRGISYLVLDEQTREDAFGSWDHHFSGLEVTTQKKWCQLPGFPMPDEEFPENYVTASGYQKYLALYCKRFGISVRRGCRVNRIEKGISDGSGAAWIVECNNDKGDVESIPALTVVIATGKHRVPQRDTSNKDGHKLHQAGILTLHSTDLKDDGSWETAIRAAQNKRLCIVGFGNSASDVCTAILKHCGAKNCGIHLSARTVPPVVQHRFGPFGVDTLGNLIRSMPQIMQEVISRIAWRFLPGSAACNKAFPAHLPRWSRLAGRVPVIDKLGLVASGLRSGLILAHGPIRFVTDQGIVFDDVIETGGSACPVPIEMVIMATGYTNECLISREDRLNGLFRAGFSNNRLLPIMSIGDEAERIAADILRSQIE